MSVEDDRVEVDGKPSRAPKKTVTVGSPLPPSEPSPAEQHALYRENLRRQQWAKHREDLKHCGVGLPPEEPPEGWELVPTVRRTRRLEDEAAWKSYVAQKWADYRRTLLQCGVGTPPIEPPEGWEPQE